MLRLCRRFMSTKPEFTHFGNKQVQTDQKEQLVKQVFDNVSDKYDLMNDLMSLTVHRRWKDYLINEVMQPNHDTQLLDVAGGTGDIAFRFVDATRRASNDPKINRKAAHVTVLDINQSMLDVGMVRAKERGYLESEMQWVCGNAEKLPFADEQFDAYTIAFGIRNVTNIPAALKEAHRVLKKGGRCLVMEFSKVEDPILNQGYQMFSQLIPVIGQVVANDRDSYQYLVESIQKFPQQAVFADMMREAGFKNVEWEDLTFGVAAIHSGFK